MQQAARISDKTTFFLLGKLVEYDETCKEFAILRLFMQAPGIVQTREHLLAEVWGQSFLGRKPHCGYAQKNAAAKAGCSWRLYHHSDWCRLPSPAVCRECGGICVR